MDTLFKVNHCKNRSSGDNYFQFNKFQFITIVTKKLRQCYRMLILTRLIVFWNLCLIWEQCLRAIIIFFLNIYHSLIFFRHHTSKKWISFEKSFWAKIPKNVSIRKKQVKESISMASKLTEERVWSKEVVVETTGFKNLPTHKHFKWNAESREFINIAIISSEI